MTLMEVAEDWMPNLTKFISKRENQVEIATHVHHPLKHITDFKSNELTLNTTTLNSKPSVVSTDICTQIRSYYENYIRETTKPDLPEVLYTLGKSHHMMLLPECTNKYNEAYEEALSHVEAYHKTKYNEQYSKHGLIKISRIAWMAKQISAHDSDQDFFTVDIIARNIALLYMALLNKLLNRDVEEEIAMPEFEIEPKMYTLQMIVKALQGCTAIRRCDALIDATRLIGGSDYLHKYPNFAEVLLEKVTDVFKKYKFTLNDFQELYQTSASKNTCICCEDRPKNFPTECQANLYIGETFGLNLHLMLYPSYI